MSNYSESWDILRDASSRRGFLDIPKRAAEVGLLKELVDCLKSYDFITIKVSNEAEELGGGIDALISDYNVALNVLSGSRGEFARDLAVLEQIQQGLTEHRDAIDREKTYLPEKLWGFLVSRKISGIPEFLEQIKRSSRPWMCPVNISDRGDRGAIRYIQIISDSKTAFCLSNDESISSWNLNNGAELGVGRHSALRSFVITPSGKVIVVGLSDGTLEIYDTENLNKLGERTGFHRGTITSIAISPDIKWLASCSSDRTIKILKLNKRSKDYLKTFYQDDSITCITFLENTGRLISGSGNGLIRIWDLESMELLGTIEAYRNLPITSIVSIPKTNFIAVGSTNSTTINICDLVEQRKVEPSLDGAQGGVNALSITPNGKYLISGSTDKVVRVWDWKKRIIICSTERNSSITACSVDSESTKIVIGEISGQVCFFSIQGISYSPENSKTRLKLLEKVWLNSSEKRLFSSVFPKQRSRSQPINQPIRLPTFPRGQLPRIPGMPMITFGIVSVGLLMSYSLLNENRRSVQPDPVPIPMSSLSSPTPTYSTPSISPVESVEPSVEPSTETAANKEHECTTLMSFLTNDEQSLGKGLIQGSSEGAAQLNLRTLAERLRVSLTQLNSFNFVDPEVKDSQDDLASLYSEQITLFQSYGDNRMTRDQFASEYPIVDSKHKRIVNKLFTSCGGMAPLPPF